jgi:hypothetical protein
LLGSLLISSLPQQVVPKSGNYYFLTLSPISIQLFVGSVH